MKRIAIIGNAGGGKSRLARRIGQSLNVPVFEIDAVEWRPGWVRSSGADVAEQHAKWLGQACWIIDGWGERHLIDARLDAADTIVIVDHAFPVHVWWVLKRYAAALAGRPDHWPPRGCPAALPVIAKLLRFMWRVEREVLPPLVERLQGDGYRKRVIHLRTPRELRDWQRRVMNA